ncbi:MAG: hypothetical protein IR164_16030 [Devosia sp.]|uniref:hypothetical protein n=1 Tax=Devosia sp. TaxID=1871048 RepID=UPI0019DF3CC3|nr:hypothetical protein [Devosia sp.]MBF0680437.1 hypothetical protein [Devosia sp.]
MLDRAGEDGHSIGISGPQAWNGLDPQRVAVKGIASAQIIERPVIADDLDIAGADADLAIESETASVTIFDQEALRSALSAIGAPSEGEAYYWVAERPNCIMHPKLFRSEAQANNWAASITVRPPATVRPLYAHPTPQEAPSEVTEDAVFLAMTKADDLDIALCDDDAREILTAALNGGK